MSKKKHNKKDNNKRKIEQEKMSNSYNIEEIDTEDILDEEAYYINNDPFYNEKLFKTERYPLKKILLTLIGLSSFFILLGVTKIIVNNITNTTNNTTTNNSTITEKIKRNDIPKIKKEDNNLKIKENEELDKINEPKKKLENLVSNYCQFYDYFDEGIKTDDYKKIVDYFKEMKDGKFGELYTGENLYSMLISVILDKCYIKFFYEDIERFSEQVKLSDFTSLKDKFNYFEKRAKKYWVQDIKEIEKQYKNLNKDNIIKNTVEFDDNGRNWFQSVILSTYYGYFIKNVPFFRRTVFYEHELISLGGMYIDSKLKEFGMTKDEYKKEVMKYYGLKEDRDFYHLVEEQYKELFEKYGLIDETFQGGYKKRKTFITENLNKIKNQKEFKKDYRKFYTKIFYAFYFLQDDVIMNPRRIQLYFDRGNGIFNTYRTGWVYILEDKDINIDLGKDNIL